MKKVSCKPFTFVPKVSNYSRGIFLFGKIRSSYSLLSIYSEEIFFCKKKVSRKPLTFVPEVSNSSREIINYCEFLKIPRQRVTVLNSWKQLLKQHMKNESRLRRLFFIPIAVQITFQRDWTIIWNHCKLHIHFLEHMFLTIIPLWNLSSHR